MRLAVLSDIHSNYHAFRACVDWIDQNEIDGVLFAGDYVSDCPYPQRTMKLIEDVRGRYETWFVRGNREDTMIERSGGDAEWKYPEQSLRYTAEHLNQRDIEFFQTMPLSQTIAIDRFPAISMTHGDFYGNKNMVLPGNAFMQRVLGEMRGAVHICGHSHQPFIYADHQKLVVNPGSVGVQVSGVPKAEMAVLECRDQKWSAELLRLAYDIEAEIEDFKKSGLDQCAGVWARCIKAMLRTGRHYSDECIEIVARYSGETGAAFDSPELWERAAGELGV